MSNSEKGKILFFDIETSPNVVYSWRIGRKIDLTPANIIEERKIICISYKWYKDKQVHNLQWDKNNDDKTMLKRFIKIAKSADVVVGHNGDSFDIKWIKTRAIIQDLEPINNLQSIDTLKLARNTFNFNSNRLDYLGDVLNTGRKVETGGYQLWLDVIAGNKSAMKTMLKYCDQDVRLLESVFDKLTPHANRLPVHVGVTKGKGLLSCEACGSDHIHANREYRKKNNTVMKVVTCQSCGSSRSMSKKKYLKLINNI